MLPPHRTLGIDDSSRAEDGGVAATQEAAIVVVGDEADLLAFGLVGGDETEAPRAISNRLFGEMADGEACRGQLRLRQRPQEIRLVLPRIDALPEETATAAVASDTRVVPRRDGAGVPGERALEERPEL